MDDNGVPSRVRVRGLFEDIYVVGSEHYIADDVDYPDFYKNDAIRTLWIDYEDFREATAGGTPTELARAWVQEWEAWVAKNDPYLQPTEAAPAAAPPAPSSAAAARVSAFQKRRSVYNARRAHNLISPRRDGAIHTV